MIKIKNKRGGKRPGAGRKPIPDSQKCVNLCTIINPNIRRLLDDRLLMGFTIAETIDEAIRGHFKKYFEKDFPEIEIE